jgi:hypothetical protein
MESDEKKIWIDRLISFTNENKKFPDLEEFTKKYETTPEDFLKNSETLDELKTQTWLHLYEETISRLLKSSEYNSYLVRDKMLAFYYTMIEELAEAREFVKLCYAERPVLQVKPVGIKLFDEAFTKYTDLLLSEGKTSGELATRPLVDNQLKKILKAKLYFVLDFWIKDNAENFENTDAAIEKSVHLAFDMLTKNALDSALDFGKFFFRNGKT